MDYLSLLCCGCCIPDNCCCSCKCQGRVQCLVEKIDQQPLGAKVVCPAGIQVQMLLVSLVLWVFRVPQPLEDTLRLDCKRIAFL